MASENSTTLLEMLPKVVDVVNKVTFSWYDYILFCSMLVVSAAIGIYFGCFGSKQATTKEYLMGGKTMKVFPISMSLVARLVSLRYHFVLHTTRKLSLATFRE